MATYPPRNEVKLAWQLNSRPRKWCQRWGISFHCRSDMEMTPDKKYFSRGFFKCEKWEKTTQKWHFSSIYFQKAAKKYFLKKGNLNFVSAMKLNPKSGLCFEAKLRLPKVKLKKLGSGP